MPSLDAWLSEFGDGNDVNETSRAVDAWKRINDNPAMMKSIVIRRNGIKQTAQTVRVEFFSNVREVGDVPDSNSNTERRGVVVFGVRNHPTVADTEIEEEDQFGIDGKTYTVRDVVEYAGEVQATAYRDN